jgi:hypothetical protein
MIDEADLTKLTVNLVPRAVVAMEFGAALAGDTRTDTVNRALQVYAYLMEQMAFGRRIVLLDADGTTMSEVTFK